MKEQELLNKIHSWKRRIDLNLYSNNDVSKVTKMFLVNLIEDIAEEMGDICKQKKS